MNRSRPLFAVACFLSLALLAACGEPRRFGDAGGVPVSVSVHLERAFVNSMENRQARPSAGAGVAFGSGGSSGVGVGFGLSFSSTQVYLLGGDQVGQGNVFRQELKWGDNTFTVPLAPGRTLQLTADVQGGRHGWEALGAVTIPAGAPSIVLLLDGNGVKFTSPAPGPQAPAPTPAPAAGTQPSPAQPAPAPAPAP